MKKIIKDAKFDEERALYASRGLKLINVAFDGRADGESALKECADVQAEGCYFNLRYPMWHVDGLKITGGEMTENCRAAIWYSHGVEIENCTMNGIKALRECADVNLVNCDISSPEFGWSVGNLTMNACRVSSVYFLMRAKDISLKDTDFCGKYSFQYVQGGTLKNCTLNTKDAFWHARGITVENCRVIGEYLAWYSEDLTFINCHISGTQPFCYCKNLKLINCSMEGCDLAFERSFAEAEITTPIISVKNPYGGEIKAPAVGEIILDDLRAKGKITIV